MFPRRHGQLLKLVLPCKRSSGPLERHTGAICAADNVVRSWGLRQQLASHACCAAAVLVLW